MNLLLLALPLLSVPSALAGDDTPTPAEQHVERALAAIGEEPDSARNYSALALALSRRGRETAESDYYERAVAATDVALALAPGDFEAAKQRTWALLGLHRYEEARDAALELYARVPDDLAVHGFLVDAHVEMGEYTAAVDACQRLLDMRPGNVPGLTRAAYLRELHGDVEGALALMFEALPRVPEFEREDRAWILTHIGHLYRLGGRLGDATEALEQALELFPDYHYALAQMGHVLAAGGDRVGARDLLVRRYEVAPHPENLFEWAAATAAAGDARAAKVLFERFEADALAESAGLDNANRELTLYLLDHADRPEEALALAQRERERRTTVLTLDGEAWALHGMGRAAEAAALLQPVLERGTADPVVLYHAGAIALAEGRLGAAEESLRDSLGRDPGSATADRVRGLLRELRDQQNDV